MVIQEAYNHGRPLIASDIGGMVEKIKNKVNGYHFRSRSANSLTTVLNDICRGKDSWNGLVGSIDVPLSISECADAHMHVYK